MLDHVTVFAFVISKSQLIAQPPRPHQQYRRILHVRIFVVEIAALSAALLRVLVVVFFLGLKHSATPTIYLYRNCGSSIIHTVVVGPLV